MKVFNKHIRHDEYVKLVSKTNNVNFVNCTIECNAPVPTYANVSFDGCSFYSSHGKEGEWFEYELFNIFK